MVRQNLFFPLLTLEEGKITENMETFELYEEKMDEKDQKWEKRYKLEYLVVVNMLGAIAMILKGVGSVVA